MIDTIDSYNAAANVHGIVLAHPFVTEQPLSTTQINALRNRVAVEKDVDAGTDTNRLPQGTTTQHSSGVCSAVIDIIRHAERHGNQGWSGKPSICLIGHGLTVGTPLEIMLRERRYPVQWFDDRHSAGEIFTGTEKAQITVVAIGRPGIITQRHVPHGKLVIDVGINVVDGKVVGDVGVEVRSNARAVTPVPGGVGVLASARIMLHTIRAAFRTLRATSGPPTVAGS